MELNGNANSSNCFSLLSRLVLGKDENIGDSRRAWGDNYEQIAQLVAGFKEADWTDVHSLAGTNHVILRALPRLLSLPVGEEHEWIESAIEAEQARIDRALGFLFPICQTLENAGTVVVIKTLDHWPDFGSDLDLFTDAQSHEVVTLMRERFKATVARQSWGDRMANKWNFEVPGLPEMVEVHVRRLGQMGEQKLIGQSIIARAMPAQFGLYTFRVPSFEDRVMVSTLQRMFRHFYLRLCDVLDLSLLADQRLVDYEYLRSLAQSTGLWEGVATYLQIISDYVTEFRGIGIPLPTFLTSAARFGGEKVSFAKNFLRIPIVPHSAQLYIAELKELLWSGEIRNTCRLGLLPLLATAAALEYRMTGSDKGIW